MNSQTTEQVVNLRPSWMQRLYARACDLLYHQYAWMYDRVSWLISLGRWRGWQAISLELLEGKRILELGFGTGNLLLDIRQMGFDVVGVDLSPQMQQIVRNKMKQRVITCPTVLAQAQELPFPDAYFDSIVATFPAPFILSTKTLAECARVLKVPNDKDFAGDLENGPVTAGRLIVVGGWVSMRSSALQMLVPLFYGRPNEERQCQMVLQMRAVGLEAQIFTRVEGWAVVSVIVAERQPRRATCDACPKGRR